MTVHDKLAKFWFTFGIIILVLGIIIMQGILIFIGLLLIGIGIWYWLRDPQEPKCRKCGFINREGSKTCPSCEGEIKKNHQVRNLALGAIIGLSIAGLFLTWIFHTGCVNFDRCLW